MIQLATTRHFSPITGCLSNPSHHQYSRKLKAVVSLGAVGKGIKDTATHSSKKPSDKCYNYKPNKHPARLREKGLLDCIVQESPD